MLCDVLNKHPPLGNFTIQNGRQDGEFKPSNDHILASMSDKTMMSVSMSSYSWPENYSDNTFLKAHNVPIKIQFVETLAIGAFLSWSCCNNNWHVSQK